MNKKGFAISVVLYTMVILVIGVFFLLLGIVRNRYTVMGNLRDSVIDGIPNVLNKVYDLNPGDWVWYSGKMWRIVTNNSDGSVKLVTENNITALAWNNSYSTDYSNSDVKKWLENEFLPTLKNRDKLLADAVWDYTVDSTPDLSKPDTEDSANSQVGLLTTYEYMMAGGSDSYLNNGYFWFTMTPQTKNSSIYGIINTGAAAVQPNAMLGIRPSIVLKPGFSFDGGTGQESSPYILNSGVSSGNVNDKINTRISGEYIKFNDTLYRIVGIEEITGQKLTKVTMADYSKQSNTIGLNEFSSDDNNRIFNRETGIGKFLDDWYNSLSITNQSMIATLDDGITWYTGPSIGFSISDSYTAANSGVSVPATIGLCHYGEIFATHFGNGYYPSNYPNFLEYNWLITNLNYNNSFISGLYINADGTIGLAPSDNALGVRPSFYLKSDVKITSGSGTESDPYNISYSSLEIEDVEKEFVINENDYTTTETSDGNKCIIGGNPNNYVWYSGKLWRIVCFNKDGTIKMVTQGNVTNLAWDTNTYDIDYSNSQVHSWLNNEFLPSLANTNSLLATSIWDYTIDTTADTTKPTASSYVEEKVGLLTMYEYMIAGASDSYLNNGYYWWTMTQNSTYHPYEVMESGSPSVLSPLYDEGIRPAVNLASSVKFDGGTGKLSNPYTIKGDKDDASKNDLLTTRISGEYINFDNTKYRIVGIEEIGGQKLTKVIMADYTKNSNAIAESVTFGVTDDNSGTIFTTESGIGEYLNNWYTGTSINSTYKSMIETNGIVWYQGPTDGINDDYTKSKQGTAVSATIGLGRYGEMFTSQYGSSSSSSSPIWIITRKSNNQLYEIDNYGTGSKTLKPTESSGVRPAFYLKSNVKISSGTGLPNNPYEIVQ